MDIQRLLTKYGENEPIFTEEIMGEFSEYSRPRVFQLINSAVENGTLARFDKGVYYIPTQTRYGQSVLTVEQVVQKKYVADKGEVFGIYGRLILQLNFLLSYQVPNAIEVITNNETMRVREIELQGRRVVLRKSRCKINKDNAAAYTIMELFSDIDLEQYKENSSVRREVFGYIKENKIVRNELSALTSVFPARTTKNLMESGLIYEIA
ncbi:MAG: hypothetical protein NC332_05230 [Firmicutes bacterium]|nr:hypothetical protein [Bacillota bacterium]